jgi:MFS family permease
MRLMQFILRNRPFIVVWLAVLISIAGIGMVSPLLAKFAEEMGATGSWLGLIFSGYAFTQIPLMPVVGRLADRFGKFTQWPPQATSGRQDTGSCSSFDC